MYIVKWYRDNSAYNDRGACPWTEDWKKALFFQSPEEARSYIRKRDPFWIDKIVIEYVHPLNIQ